MTYKEALYWHTHNGATMEQERESEILIKEALEKQIPKKPNIYSKFQRHCECGAMVKTYQNYCYDCGQALEWGGYG